jgi:CRP/FNR family cyclic AMP-dependent transcriptional regulator
MKIEPIADMLASNSFFDGLSQDQLITLGGCGKLMHFRPGQHLLREGEHAATFYVIRSGEVTIETRTPGAGSLSVARVGASGVVGYSWLFPPYRVAFDATARTAVKVIALNGDCLRKKAEADPALGYELMKRFAQIMLTRLQATRRQLLNLYTPSQGTPSEGNTPAE